MSSLFSRIQFYFGCLNFKFVCSKFILIFFYKYAGRPGAIGPRGEPGSIGKIQQVIQ